MSIYDKLMGPWLATTEEEQQKVGLLSGIPMLGLDALSSAAYGPEAALTILLGLGALSDAYIWPVTLTIIALLTVVYFSYRQTIEAYPNGGGSYTVAKENLGTRFGLVAAASLMIDYTLTVAVGIAAGVGSLVSVAPVLHPYILPLCLFILAVITLVNLHGVKESGRAFIIPTYLFIGTLAAVVVIGVAKTAMSGGHPVAVEAPPALPAATMGVGLWLLLRCFASGCTAMTGVEAISNGVTAFAAPATKNAQRTLTCVIAVLCFLLAGIAFLCRAYGVGATDPDSAAYQSILSQLTAAVTGRGVFYYVTMACVIAIVCLSANTSFAGFPRLTRLLAIDNFLPYAFAIRGRRLVYSEGIVVLALMSGALLAAFDGITDRLIPLFAVGAFGAFTLSQAGMVAHWRKQPKDAGGSKKRMLSMLVNGMGATSTGIVLLIVMVTKFASGAWVVLLLIPLLFGTFLTIRRHYAYVERHTACAVPVDLRHLQPPVVVIVLRKWSTTARKAVRLAAEISPEIVAVHINTDNDNADQLQEDWRVHVEAPFQKLGREAPRLLCIDSPYRRFLHPLFNTLRHIESMHRGRTIAVVVPELMSGKWYNFMLHNRLAAVLKAALLLHDDRRIAVINVPWYLNRGED